MESTATAVAQATDNSAAPGTLQIVSPHPQIIQDEFGPAFEVWYKAKTGTSVKVVWRDLGGTSAALSGIVTAFEKRPEGIDLDMFFGGGVDPYMQLKSLGLLQAYEMPADILAAIPKELNGVPLYDPQYSWYGTAISGFGIVYNKPLVKQLGIPEIKTWQDLTDPKLFTWVGAGDPRQSGTVHMMYEIMLQAYGWDKGWQVMTAFGGNARNFVNNSGDIPREVSAGRIAAGTAIDFYAWSQVEQAGAEQVGFVLPEGLTVINPDSIAILKGAPHLDAARAFEEFVLSEDGQKLWYLKAGSPGGPRKASLLRMPVRTDMYDKYGAGSPVLMNPFKWTAALRYDSKLGTLRYQGLNDLFGAIIVDSHDDLVAAWKKAVDSNQVAAMLPDLSKPPVTEEGLNALVDKLKDPVFKNTTTADWITFARDKYKRMAR